MATVTTLRLNVDSRGAEQGFKKAEKGAKGFAVATTKAKSSQERLLDEMSKLTKAIRQHATALTRVKQKRSAATKEVKKSTKAVKASERATRKASKTMGMLTRRVGAAAAAYAAFRIVKESISLFADFERQVLTVQAITGKSAQQIKPLSDEIKRLGASTEFTAIQAGKAAVVLARAGLTPQQNMKTLAKVLDLSTAAAVDLDQAADITLTTMKQFGLGIDETSRVMDVLVKQSNLVQGTVPEIAEALKFVGPVAKSAGIELEEVVGILGTLSDNGIRASMAGTNLRQTIAQLVNPSSQARAEIERLGLNIKDLDPRTNSLVDIFERFGKTEFDVSSATKILGVRQLALGAILSKNTKKTRENLAALKDAKGTTQEFTKVVREGTKQAVDELSSSWDGLMISIGQTGPWKGLLEFLTSINTELTKIVNNAGKIDDSGATDPALGAGVRLGERTDDARGKQDREAADKFLAGLPDLKGKGKGKTKKEFLAEIQAEEDQRKVRVAATAKEEAAKEVSRQKQEQADKVALMRAEKMGSLRSQFLNDLDQEVRLANMAEDARNAEIIALDEINRRKEEGLALTMKEEAEIRKQAASFAGILSKIDERNAKEAERIEELDRAEKAVAETSRAIGEAIGSSIGGALERVIFEFEDLKDVAQATANEVIRELFRIVVVRNIVNAVGGAFSGLAPGEGGVGPTGPVIGPKSADGNVFSGGSLVPFANGGVVGGPTFFPMADGGTGLMGEAGPEAIMPLKRGPDGKLGVETSGGGGNGPQVVNINISTPDAASFHNSRRQTRDDASNIAQGLRF